MNCRWRVLASIALLVALAGTPALAAVCSVACADPYAVAADPESSCHEPGDGGTRVEAASAVPCGSHAESALEPAVRLQSHRDHAAAPTAAASVRSGDAREATGRPAAVTPGPIRPGPSRPPLVLRV